jgi:hypothetical protein
MSRPPAEIFADLQRALFGENGAVLCADALEVKHNSVRHWKNGTSRIPPGVWVDMQAIATERLAEIADLMAEAAAAEAAARHPPG